MSDLMSSARESRQRLFVVDASAVFRAGLRQALEGPTCLVVGECDGGDTAAIRVWQSRPDLLVLDPGPAGEPGVQLLEQLRDRGRRQPTLLIAEAIEAARLLAWARLGVRGVVPRTATPGVWTAAVRAIGSGEYWFGRKSVSVLIDVLLGAEAAGAPAERLGHKLTRRERDVLALVLQGRSNRQMAEALKLSEETVKHHLTTLFGKSGVHSRLELALSALGQRRDVHDA